MKHTHKIKTTGILSLAFILIFAESCNTQQNKNQVTQDYKSLKFEWVSTNLSPSHEIFNLTLTEKILVNNPTDKTVEFTFAENESTSSSCFKLLDTESPTDTVQLIIKSDKKIKLEPKHSIEISLINTEYSIPPNLTGKENEIYIHSIKIPLETYLKKKRNLYITIDEKEVKIEKTKNYLVEIQELDSFKIINKLDFTPPEIK